MQYLMIYLMIYLRKDISVRCSDRRPTRADPADRAVPPRSAARLRTARASRPGSGGRRSAERISPRPHAVQRPCGAAKWSNRRTVKRSGQTAERPNPSGQATDWSEQTPAARRGTWPEPPATSSTPPFALLRRAVSAASKRS